MPDFADKDRDLAVVNRLREIRTMMRFRLSSLLAMSSAVWVLALPALAQSGGAAAAGPATGTVATASLDLEEIIVTARKRKENLAEVPLTINVISAESIERANAENVSDIAAQTPGFSFKAGFGRTGGGQGASVRPSIRGMSSIIGAPNAAFFVDGIFVADNVNSYQLDNLERVEVIKGPQSALFGRQTFSGAINFITRRPENELKGKLKLTGGQYETREASGFLSGAIVDDVLLAEVNARYSHFGGDYVNGDSGKRDIGGQESYDVGGRLILTPFEGLEATLSLGYSQNQDKGYGYGFQGGDKNNCFPGNIIRTQGGIPVSSSRARGFYCGEVKVLPRYSYNNDAVEALGYNGLDREFYRASLNLTYTTESDWSVTSISAVNHNQSVVGQDNTLVPSANPSLAITGSELSDYSQEVRFLTPQNARIRALAGFYFYGEDQLPGFTVNQTTRAVLHFDSGDKVRSHSFFGMIEGNVTDDFTLGAEARYQDETITGTDERAGTAGTPTPFANQREAKFDAFLPRFTARYTVNRDLNIYASAAKGNKPGGFNDLPTDASAADLQRFRAAGFEVFDEESAWSYELGAKGQAFELVNFGASAFYIDWTQQQLSRGEVYTRTNGTPNSVPFVQNAGKSEIKGFEFDLSGNPTDWLFLRFGYTYVNAEFVEFYDDTTEEIYDTDGRASRLPNGQTNPADVDGLDGDLKGNKLPQTPAHQFIFTAQVTQPVSDDFDFIARSDLSYESKRYSQVDNLNWAGDSYNLNVNLSLESPNWAFSLFARNLLDDDTPAVVTRLLDFNRPIFRPNPLTGTNQLTFLRDFTVSAPRKRLFGGSLTYKF
jgi:iron complex outermembrane recepter protein